MFARMVPVRLVLAALTGVAVAVAAAVVLGDYPLTGAVPWVTVVLVPLLIGVAMTLVVGAQNRWLWVATGPLAALSVLWGVRIATGWGLDPWPASWWAVMAVALVWPPVWGLRFAGRSARPPAEAATTVTTDATAGAAPEGEAAS